MENFISRLSKYEKPKTNDAEELSSAKYFYDPFSHLTVHEQLINDYETIQVFEDWINGNKHLIKGKVVVDVGCGMGLTSMMAAKAGAARVFSIDWSSMVDYTKKIVKANHLDDIIQVIKGRISDVTLPSNHRKVDVIISMWMGYSLLQGDKLKAVLQARDKWLKPNGFIIPDRAQLYISAIADIDYKENNIDWWKSVYGFDMSCVTDDSLKYAHYKVVPPESIITNKCRIKDIDLRRNTYKDVMKEVIFCFTAKRNDFIQALCTSFTVKFSKDSNQTELSTDPALPPKFWAQTVLYFKEYIMIKRKENVKGSIGFFNLKNDPRFLGLVVGTCFEGEMCVKKNVNEYLLRL